MSVIDNDRQHPPLWIWAASLGLAFLVIVGLAGWTAAGYGKARDMYLTKYFALGRLDATSAGTPVIVALGSSKTRCALEFDQDMEALLRKQGIDARFIRITRGLATFEDFHAVFDRLAVLRPRLVLVEADLMLYQPNVYAPEGMSALGWRKRVRTRIDYAFRGDRAFGDLHPEEVAENTSASRILGCGHGDAETPASRSSKLAIRRGSTEAERQPYMEALRRLRGDGVTVELLTVSRAPWAEAEFPLALRAAGASSRNAILNTGVVSDFWKETPVLPTNEFLDAAHLTTVGREQFSGLFAARMREQGLP